MPSRLLHTTTILVATLRVAAQLGSGSGEFPHNYTGIPQEGYSTAWQKYFEVTDLPQNVSSGLTKSWAGNIGVDRLNQPNNTLFFWAFEKEDGSLTSSNSNEPWIIWLNGGPGSSSMIGLMTENGPLRVNADYSITKNNLSWNTLADTVWVDQPVGTGFSTAGLNGMVPNEDQMAEDFVKFLANLVKVFPSLQSRPLYLTGESYAGVYIPYIARAILSSSNPPVNMKAFAIGDGAIGDMSVVMEVSTLTTIQTYPQLINFDTQVYDYFKEQEHLCGYDLNFTYPQNGLFGTLNDPNTGLNRSAAASPPLKGTSLENRRKILAQALRVASADTSSLEERRARKRDLSGRTRGQIDPAFGCDLLDNMISYALKFAQPWNMSQNPDPDFDVYYIPDALSPEVPSDPSVFLNSKQVRAALHAPTSKDWIGSTPYMFSGGSSVNEFGDPSPAPMVFLSDLASSAASKGVKMIFYSGNDDSLVAHRGTEAVIQNMTFGGTQGFSRKPSTPWHDDDGNFAGIVHQERNVTYVLFKDAGHLVPLYQPKAAYTFLREFILGSNTTGLVDSSSNTVVGGEDSSLAKDYMPGNAAIFYGAGTTASSIVAPSATLAAWESFLATAVPSPSVGSSSNAQPNGSVSRRDGGQSVMVFCSVAITALFLSFAL